MAALGVCAPCVEGDHEHHYYVIQAAPEGTCGGSRCKCEGECVDGRYASAHIEDIARLLIEAKML